MENNSSRNGSSDYDTQDIWKAASPRLYNIRPCPHCHKTIFGMPGGRDAQCTNCGYKDPCCSD